MPRETKVVQIITNVDEFISQIELVVMFFDEEII